MTDSFIVCPANELSVYHGRTLPLLPHQSTGSHHCSHTSSSALRTTATTAKALGKVRVLASNTDKAITQSTFTTIHSLQADLPAIAMVIMAYWSAAVARVKWVRETTQSPLATLGGLWAGPSAVTTVATADRESTSHPLRGSPGGSVELKSSVFITPWLERILFQLICHTVARELCTCPPPLAVYFW